MDLFLFFSSFTGYSNNKPLFEVLKLKKKHCIGMEIAEREENLRRSIVDRRNNRKGKRPSPDGESFPTGVELRNSQVYKGLEMNYTQ
jgi:hypothetical protein